jgi:hypothetical protein
MRIEEIEAMNDDELVAWSEKNPTLAKVFLYSRETGLSVEQVLSLPIREIDEFVDAFYVVCLHKKRAMDLQAAYQIPLGSELVM